VVPLQLERRGQSVDAFIQQLHHAIVAAVNVDFANSDRRRLFNLHCGIGCSNTRPAHPSKTFPHALKKPRPIIVPLVPVIVANEIGNSFPISAIDRVKEMFRVEANLMLGPPKPKQIQADGKCNGQHADSCSTKRNRHTRQLFFLTSHANQRGSMINNTRFIHI
jgi:hypothetical protein